MNIERVFVGIAVFLLLPYILLSTLLHTYGTSNGMGGPSMVPPDHHWRLIGHAKHGGPNTQWSGFPPKTTTVPEADSQSYSRSISVDPSSVLALAPGTAAVLAWIDMQRRTFPERFQLPRFHFGNNTSNLEAVALAGSSTPVASHETALRAASLTSSLAHATKASTHHEAEPLPSYGAASSRLGSSFVPLPRDIHGAAVSHTSTDAAALSAATSRDFTTAGAGAGGVSSTATRATAEMAPLLPPSPPQPPPPPINRPITTTGMRLNPTNSSHMGTRRSSASSNSSSSSPGKEVADSAKDVVKPKQRRQRARCLLFTMDSIDG